MSRQSDAKLAQGYMAASPTCTTCSHFRCDEREVQGPFSTWLDRRNLRCNLGHFKVMKRGWCSMYDGGRA